MERKKNEKDEANNRRTGRNRRNEKKEEKSEDIAQLHNSSLRIANDTRELRISQTIGLRAAADLVGDEVAGTPLKEW